MGKERSAEKRRYWQQVLDQQSKSGLSIREFCTEAGISQPSFYAWRKKLQDHSCRAPQSGTAKQVPDGKESLADRAPFIPLSVIDSTTALEVIHPSGCRVRVCGEVNSNSLRQILAALD